MKAKHWAQIAGIVLAGCALVPNALTQPLHIANAGEPQTLDPHRYNLRLEETLLNDLFEGLVTFNARGELIPGAANQWTTSDDGLTWTFALRQDLKWSDGEPLTAHDFVFSLRRLQNPQTAASLAYFMYMLENAPAVNSGKLPPERLGVHAPDPYTLVLRLSKPYPYLLERLLYPTGYPVPKHAIERYGDDWIRPENWVSNGAYTLAEWRPQAHVALRANPNFHSPAKLAEVYYHPVVNEQSAYNRFRNNELHVIGSFPAGELPKVARQHKEALRMSGLLSMMYLVFNTQSAPFDKLPVRQALSLAIDQSTLTDRVLRSGNEPAFSFTPHLLNDYDSVPVPHVDSPMNERLLRARELLAGAGYDANNPLKLTLRHVSGLENKKVNLAITGMWQRIGVKAQLHQSELRTHFADLRQGDFEVAWAGWIGESNAEHYLSLLQSDVGQVNYGRFADTTFDRLMQAAQLEADVQLRNAKLHAAEAHSVHLYPVIPLYTNTVRRLVDPALKGWFENARDVHQARYLSF